MKKVQVQEVEVELSDPHEPLGLSGGVNGASAACMLTLALSTVSDNVINDQNVNSNVKKLKCISNKMPISSDNEGKGTSDPQAPDSVNQSDSQNKEDLVQRDTETNWLETYSDTNLNKLQPEDNDLEPLLCCSNKEKPDQAELHLTSPRTEVLWLNRRQLVLKNGVLHYLDGSKNEEDYPCVVVNKIKKASRKYKARMLGCGVMQQMNVILGIAKQTDKATTPEDWMAQLSERLALIRHKVRKKLQPVVEETSQLYGTFH